MTAGQSAVFLFVMISILLMISLVDIRRRVIPDALNLGLGVAGFSTSLFVADAAPMGVLANAALYFIVFWLVRQGHYYATGRIGLGLGDVKFAGAAGCWIGFSALSVFIGIASVSALLFIALSRAFWPFPMDRHLPFGPFLSFALAITWLIQSNPILMEPFRWS